MSTSKGQKVVFLDRDDTINEGGLVYRIEDWKWITGAIEGMRKLQDAGYLLAVVTNQTGVGEGYYTEKDMHVLHDYMKEELMKQGVRLSAIAYSLKIGDEDEKPNTGMLKRVEKAIQVIDYLHSWMIGDKEKDAQFGKNAGVKTALIRSKYWEDSNLKVQPDIIVNSLFEAAEKIVTGNQ